MKFIIKYYERAVTITLLVEKDLKQSFYEPCDDFGMSASTTFNILMKTVVRERKIPFEIHKVDNSEIRNKALYAFEEMRCIVAESMTPAEMVEILIEKGF